LPDFIRGHFLMEMSLYMCVFILLLPSINILKDMMYTE
jgi:hypothetical protein